MEKRFIESGFISISRSEYSVAGGLSAKTWASIIRIIGVAADFLSTYLEDFKKGLEKGLSGKPLYSMLKRTV